MHQGGLGKACVIGAGPSGLAMAKNLKKHGFSFDVLERNDEVGGIWNFHHPDSPVYRSTHLISSKKLTQYADFPMPDSYPDYPNRELVFDYLKSYARQFDLYPMIRFHTAVVKVERSPSGWEVEMNHGERKTYRWLALGTGHEWWPRLPKIPIDFSGTVLHSFNYRDPTIFSGKRVLVVGAGNSGCDIAADLAPNAARTLLSLRRGYYFLPKYFHGRPSGSR